MVNKRYFSILFVLPSIIYLMESSGILGLTGVGFAFDVGRLANTWPFSIFAAPLYLASGYPPVWALVVSGLRLVSTPTKALNQQILSWSKALSWAILIVVVAIWVARCFIEPFAWTRLVLTFALLIAVPYRFRRFWQR
jgi:hypothetical protein